MVRTVNLTLQQGDTERLIIPVLDGDDPNTTFESGFSADEVEFAVVDSGTGTATVTTADVRIAVEQFGDVKLGAGSFESIDQIPDTQDVLVITLPATETAQLLPASCFSYQVRLAEDPTGAVVSVLTGTVSVDGSPLEQA